MRSYEYALCLSYSVTRQVATSRLLCQVMQLATADVGFRAAIPMNELQRLP